MEHNMDAFHYYMGMGYIRQLRKEIDAKMMLIFTATAHPRIRKGFTHYNIDKKHLTFTYHLN